jgi:adenine-specific DNA methylase
LAAGSVDLIVTDPPFFDNVHYSELADFFFAWQQLAQSPFRAQRKTTRHPDEVQDTNSEQFAAKLRAVFAECHRVLRDEGLLVFTYHHSRPDGWTSLADAVVGAGFSFINCHPVKSEMSVAAPKSQAKEPIQLDIILVCQKQSADKRIRCDAHSAPERAISQGTGKLDRLRHSGLELSVNDRRVVFISQYLVEACAGRSAEQLAAALGQAFTDLDVAAMRPLEPVTYPVIEREPHNRKQLVLLEKATLRRSSQAKAQERKPVSYLKRRRGQKTRTAKAVSSASPR